MKTYYYPNTIYNVSVAFLNMFNDIVVKKYDRSNNVVKSISVPIRLGPVDKMHDSRREDYNITNEPFYMTLPRMAVVGPQLSYNPERATSVNTVRHFYNETLGLDLLSDFHSDPHPTPYDFQYDLHIRSQDMVYYAQILENILPYFNPSRSLRVKEFSFLNVERSLIVKFNGDASLETNEEMGESEIDQYSTVLSFVVEGWMYYPKFESSIIKKINSKYYVNTTGDYTDGYKTEEYETSGYTGTSAFPDVYETSGYDATSDTYWVTSADSFDV